MTEAAPKLPFEAVRELTDAAGILRTTGAEPGGLDLLHPGTGTRGFIHFGESGSALRGYLGDQQARGAAEVEAMLRRWVDRPKPDLITFITERIAEDRYFHRRRDAELDALQSIAHTAWGCPGCGGRGGFIHGCPGGRQPDDPGEVWTSILRDLASLWSEHRDYDPAWTKVEPTAFEICEQPEEGHTFNYETRLAKCTSCGHEEPL